MQHSDPETRLLAALARALAAELGKDHPLALAAREGQIGRTPASMASVHELLATLDEPTRDRVLAAVHREMREDLGAIWAFLPSATRSGGLQ